MDILEFQATLEFPERAVSPATLEQAESPALVGTAVRLEFPALVDILAPQA